MEKNSNTFLKHLSFCIFLLVLSLFLSTDLLAQPNVTRNNSGTSSTSFQLGSTSAKKTQQLYALTDLTGAMAGDILKVYFMYHSTTAQSFDDLVVSIGQTTNTALTATFETGLTEVFNGSITFPAGTAGDWFEIPLTTVFAGYDPAKSIIIETKWTTNPTSTSWTVRTGSSDPTGTNRKVYASSPDATSGTLTTTRANFGFLVVTPTNMVYDSSNVTQAVVSTVMAGSVDQQILGIEIFMTGTLNPLNITQFTLNTNGTSNVSDISNAKLFFTGNIPDFSASNQFGTTVVNPSGTYLINGSQELSMGMNYFWLTYDISPTATEYNLVDGECTSVTIGGSPYTPSITAPVGNRAIRYSLTGTKTIGSTGNYTTFASAIEDLNIVGVGSGGVTFNVASAETFNESNLRITATGTVSNPIIFITSSPGTNPTINFTGTSASNDAAFKILGGDYITFDGLNIQNAGTTSDDYIEYGFHLEDSSGIDGCQYNMFKNCVITLDTSNNNTRGVYLKSFADSENGTNSYNKFYNNTIQSSHVGYYFYGISSNYDVGNEIGIEGDGSSMITNIGGGTSGAYYGVYLYYESNVKIFNTEFSDFKGNGTLAVYGIYSIGSTGIGNSAEIYSNELHDIIGGGVVYGIYFSSGVSYNVYKNVIHNIESQTKSTSALYGIYFSGTTLGYAYNNMIYDLRNPSSTNSTVATSALHLSGGTDINVYHNTIFLDYTEDAGNSSTSLYVGSTSPTNVDLRNNIFVNLTDANLGNYAAAFRKGGTSLDNIKSRSNNNLYYAGTPSAKNLIFYDGTNSDSTLDDYKIRVTPRDQSAISINPTFISAVSPYDLHIDSTVITQIESGGTLIDDPIAIEDDIDGQKRFGAPGYSGSGTAPDIGADEFEGIGIDLLGPAIIYSTFSAAPTGTNLTFSNVDITDPSGVDVTSGLRPRLYYKKFGDDNTYVGNTSSDNGWKWVEATGTGGSPFNFMIDYTLLYNSGGGSGSVSIGDTLQYFVVAQDSLSNVGMNSGIFANPPSSVNLTVDAFPITGTINEYLIKKSFSGTITLGGTMDAYPTLKSFFDDVNGGVVIGNVTANVVADLNETETASLNQFEEYPPLSNFTITINPVGAREISGTISGAVIKLNGADRLIIDGLKTGSNTLTISNKSEETSTAALWISSLGNGLGATDNVIRNCNISAGTNSITSTFGIYVAGTSISTTGTGADNHNITIENNNITKAYYGIYVRGTTTRRLDSLIILRNNIGSDNPAEYVTYRGIEIQSSKAPLISQNVIFNLNIGTSVNIAAIDLGQYNSDAEISRNKIYGIKQTSTSGYGAYGINISSGTSNNGITIVNNVIYDIVTDGDGTSTTYNPFGIRITGGDNHKIYFNSINLFGSFFNTTTNDYSSAIIITSNTVDNIDIQNNIFTNTMTGGTGAKCFAIYGVSGVTYGTINYNDYYVSGPNGVFGYNGSDVTTLAAWQTFTGQDLNSMDSDPMFNSPTLLIPQTGSPVLGGGVSIPSVTVDFLGNARGTPPSIGAYEIGGDAAPPVIVYTPLANTTSTSNRSFSNVVITDPSNVNIDPGTRPRVYYKKSTHENTYIDNTSSTNGWKYAEASGSGSSPFDFTIDYSRLFGGSVTAGDEIQYFVVAQDLAALVNVGINSGVFASVPVSVALTAAAFPVTGTINSYFISTTLSGTYNVGLAQIYPSLTGAGGLFTAINNNVVSGNIIINIVSDLTEDGTYALNEWSEDGVGGYTVTIQPDSEVERVISGSVSNGMIRLNGTDRLTIDGRKDGSGRYLRFKNTSTSNPTFTFLNDATNNTLRNCYIEGATTSSTNGIIMFGTGLVTGNDNNIITENIIRDLSDGSGIPANAVYSSGSASFEEEKVVNIMVGSNSTDMKLPTVEEINLESQMFDVTEFFSSNSTLSNSDNIISNNEIFNFSSYGIHISNTGNGENWTISDNSFYNNLTTPPSAAQTSIRLVSGAGSNVVTNNYIGGSEANAGGTAWSNSGTGAFVGIEIAADTGAGNISLVQNNIIRNIIRTSTSSATFAGINITQGDLNVVGNTIGDTSAATGITIMGSSTTHGINSQSRRGNITISDNLIAHLAAEGTGSSVRVRGIAVHNDSTGTIIISGNTIRNLSTQSGGTGIGASSPVAMGIYHFPSGWGYLTDISGNTIYAVSANNTGALGNVVAGMLLTNYLGRVAGNYIYDIRNQSTGTSSTLPPIAAGMYLRFCDDAYVYNNMISIGSDQTTDTEFNGIWNAGGDTTNSFDLYYNSISVSGSVTSGSHPSFGFLRGDNTGATQPSIVTLKNNIFNNVRTGGTGSHYAIANQNSTGDPAGWPSTASDYNVLNSANNLTVGLWGTTDLKFNEWQLTTGGDANSKTGDPLFLSPLNLHITNAASPASNSGLIIAGIDDDFDGDLRSTSTPDIGADEFTSDETIIAVNYNAGWNMISNPVTRTAGTDSVKLLYPASLFNYAFGFTVGVGYQQKYILENGVGYWAKFVDAGTSNIAGFPINTDSIDVELGWNMVGSISSAIDTSTITSDPPGIKASQWFGYDAGYFPTSQIIPGKAYWIKANANGKFIFSTGGGLVKQLASESILDGFNTITITDKAGNSQTLYFGADYEGINTDMYEMPPEPPSDAFDSRFENGQSGYLLQTHDSELSESVSFPITIQSTAYPLTISWQINSDKYSYELNYGDAQSKQIMTNDGWITINNPDITRLTLLAKNGKEIPAEFALMQNYPNPFNPVTNIKYALPEPSRVTLEIFNILGQKVRTLINEEKPAGYHVVEWNGKNEINQFTGSGVFYVRISAEGTSGKNFTKIRKMILLR